MHTNLHGCCTEKGRLVSPRLAVPAPALVWGDRPSLGPVVRGSLYCMPETLVVNKEPQSRAGLLLKDFDGEIVVAAVEPQSPLLGFLTEGAVIVGVDGHQPTDANDCAAMLHAAGIGTTLLVRRPKVRQKMLLCSMAVSIAGAGGVHTIHRHLARNREREPLPPSPAPNQHRRRVRTNTRMDAVPPHRMPRRRTTCVPRVVLLISTYSGHLADSGSITSTGSAQGFRAKELVAALAENLLNAYLTEVHALHEGDANSASLLRSRVLAALEAPGTIEDGSHDEASGWSRHDESRWQAQQVAARFSDKAAKEPPRMRTSSALLAKLFTVPRTASRRLHFSPGDAPARGIAAPCTF